MCGVCRHARTIYKNPSEYLYTGGDGATVSRSLNMDAPEGNEQFYSSFLLGQKQKEKKSRYCSVLPTPDRLVKIKGTYSVPLFWALVPIFDRIFCVLPHESFHGYPPATLIFMETHSLRSGQFRICPSSDIQIGRNR